MGDARLPHHSIVLNCVSYLIRQMGHNVRVGGGRGATTARSTPLGVNASQNLLCLEGKLNRGFNPSSINLPSMNREPQRKTRWDTKHIHLELLAQFIFTYKVALKVNPHAPANKQATKASALFFVRLGYGFCDAVLQRALLKLHTTLKYFVPIRRV